MILCWFNFFFSLLFVCLAAKKKLDLIAAFSTMDVFQKDLYINKCFLNVSLHIFTYNAHSNTPHFLFPMFLKWKDHRKKPDPSLQYCL